jgi:flagellar hook assembly protein FlgD
VPPAGSPSLRETSIGAVRALADGGMSIEYSTSSHAAGATLELFDIAGRVVRRLVDGQRPAGHYVVAWNGLDASGARMPRSVYILRLRAGPVQAVRKLVIARP